MSAISNFEKHFNELKLLHKHIVDLTRADFEAMSKLVLQAKQEGVIDQAEQLCLDFIKENKDLIIVSYGLALLYYEQEKDGTEVISRLVEKFQDKGKSNIVDYLLDDALKHSQSAGLLKMVAMHREKMGQHDQAIENWKKVIAIDQSDFHIPTKLAKHYEKVDSEESLNYYQIAFSRSLEQNAKEHALELIRKMISIDPSQIDRHLRNIESISISSSPDEKHDLYAFLLKNQEKNDVDSMPSIVKIIKVALQNNVVLSAQIFLLIKAYRHIYQDHELLEDFLIHSRLLAEVKNKREDRLAKDFFNIIELFEKYIQFRQGCFVRHKSFGLGVLRGLEKAKDLKGVVKSNFIVDFEKKKNHEMTLRIAVGSLSVVSPRNLYCLQIFKPEELKKIFDYDDDNVNDALLTAVLETLEKPSQKKEILALLKHFVAEDELNDCWNYLKKTIDESERFAEIDKAIWFYDDKEDPLTRTLRNLKKTSNSAEQMKIIDSFFATSEAKKKESVAQILDHVVSNINRKNEHALFFLCYLSYLKSHFHLDYPFDFEKGFRDVYDEENLLSSFMVALHHALRLRILEFCTNYLDKKRLHSSFKNLFYELDFREKEILIDYFIHASQKQLMDELFTQVSNKFSEYPSEFTAFVHRFLTKGGYDFPEGDLLEKSIRLLDSLHRGVASETEKNSSKRLFTALEKSVFDKDRVFDFLQKSDDEVLVEKIFSALEKVTFLENEVKVKIRTVHERWKSKSGK